MYVAVVCNKVVLMRKKGHQYATGVGVGGGGRRKILVTLGPEWCILHSTNYAGQRETERERGMQTK